MHHVHFVWLCGCAVSLQPASASIIPRHKPKHHDRHSIRSHKKSFLGDVPSVDDFTSGLPPSLLASSCFETVNPTDPCDLFKCSSHAQQQLQSAEVVLSFNSNTKWAVKYVSGQHSIFIQQQMQHLSRDEQNKFAAVYFMNGQVEPISDRAYSHFLAQGRFLRSIEFASRCLTHKNANLKWFFQLDDDTLVSPTRILAFSQHVTKNFGSPTDNRYLFGKRAFWGNGSPRYGPAFFGGTGHLFSVALLKFLDTQVNDQNWHTHFRMHYNGTTAKEISEQRWEEYKIEENWSCSCKGCCPTDMPAHYSNVCSWCYSGILQMFFGTVQYMGMPLFHYIYKSPWLALPFGVDAVDAQEPHPFADSFCNQPDVQQLGCFNVPTDTNSRLIMTIHNRGHYICHQRLVSCLFKQPVGDYSKLSCFPTCTSCSKCATCEGFGASNAMLTCSEHDGGWQ